MPECAHRFTAEELAAVAPRLFPPQKMLYINAEIR